MWIYKIAIALELALVLLEATLHWNWLPLGGGPVQQLGIVLGAAVVLNEVFPGRPPPAWHRGAQNKKRGANNDADEK